jgi:hypothetical protein
MKFLSIYTPSQRAEGCPPSSEMGQLIEEFMKSGILVSTGGLLPISQGGACVKRSGDEITVMDGPFTETKELVGGFAVLEAKSREDVIEMAKRFLRIAGDGESELRQMMEPGGAQ